jgi:allantoinase
MSARPAAIAGLQRKGRIEIGAEADFAVFADEEAFVVDAAVLKHKNPVCPYDGKTLTGVIRRTFLRGVPVTDDVPGGQLLRRGRD